jgi:hypothetical protein
MNIPATCEHHLVPEVYFGPRACEYPCRIPKMAVQGVRNRRIILWSKKIGYMRSVLSFESELK